jgi:hypothetical protein
MAADGALPRLHVLFTMDCQAPLRRARVEARPKSWEVSARAIDAFCTTLALAGHQATVFVTPACAEEHAPLLQELGGRGVDVGLLLNPFDLDGKRWDRYLGAYPADAQREIAALARDRFEAAIGLRPRSVRTAEFSAGADTFAVLSELGFQQGSLSNPGRRVRKYAVDWREAEADPHLAAGTGFLEVPVTADRDQSRGGVPPDLVIEKGDVAGWHRPLAEAQLERMASGGTAFPALCLYTANAFPYHDPGSACSKNLRGLLDYVDGLAGRYDVVSVTMAEAHRRFTARTTA